MSSTIEANKPLVRRLFATIAAVTFSCSTRSLPLTTTIIWPGKHADAGKSPVSTAR